MIEAAKVCGCCGEMKRISGFGVVKGRVRSYCKECCRKQEVARRQTRGDAIRESDRRRRASNPEARKQVERKAYRKRATIKRAELRKANSEWGKANRHKTAAFCVLKRARRMKRLPPWVDNKLLDQMAEFYAQAAQATELSGIKHHVDHIVPLRSPVVSGLHVPWNLQVLEGSENRRKGNRLTG